MATERWLRWDRHENGKKEAEMKEWRQRNDDKNQWRGYGNEETVMNERQRISNDEGTDRKE